MSYLVLPSTAVINVFFKGAFCQANGTLKGQKLCLLYRGPRSTQHGRERSTGTGMFPVVYSGSQGTCYMLRVVVKTKDRGHADCK